MIGGGKQVEAELEAYVVWSSLNRGCLRVGRQMNADGTGVEEVRFENWIQSGVWTPSVQSKRDREHGRKAEEQEIINTYITYEKPLEVRFILKTDQILFITSG